jgi:hypothetical protein
MNRAFCSRVAFRPSLEPCPPASTRSLYGSLPRKKSCADPAAVGANTCRRVLRDWSTSLPTQKPIGSSGGPPIGWSRTKPPLPPPEPRLVRQGPGGVSEPPARDQRCHQSSGSGMINRLRDRIMTWPLAGFGVLWSKLPQNRPIPAALELLAPWL